MAEQYSLDDIMEELCRRYGPVMDRYEAEDVDIRRQLDDIDRTEAAEMEQRKAEVVAELARRAALAETDPTVLLTRAMTVLSDAIRTLAERRPVTKTIERDEAGFIARIIEEVVAEGD